MAIEAIHLIFNFHSGSRSEWEGLRIEMQLRSAQQHFWATAVETVEAILKQSLQRLVAEVPNGSDFLP